MKTTVTNPTVPVFRLFFAALPDAATRARAVAAATALSLDAAARLVPCENYHVTLAFVGEIAVTQLSSVLDVGRVQRSGEFTLTLDAYDYWPKPALVVGVARAIPPALQRLWHDLHGALATHGLAFDAKRLRPHVTLAKKVSQPPALPGMCAFNWTVNEFCLMRSETSGVQTAYTVVDTWPLLYGGVES